MRIVGSSGYRCGNSRAICSGAHRCESRVKTVVRKRGWTASFRGLRGWWAQRCARWWAGTARYVTGEVY
jgi:hypothetical protein